MEIQSALRKVVERQDLTEEEMVAVMNRIMEGGADASMLAAFLTALRMKGESVGEIAGAAKSMRDKAESLKASAETIVDTCGTGGDGTGTFNISTAAAFVVAGAGITVAKHGNRAVSSRSGSADVLKCLGVNIDAGKSTVERCLEQAGIGFLFAPLMHTAMKHVIGVRKELGFRTIFNLLGPLTNPARAHVQIVGVYDARWTYPLACVLKELGCRRAYVVHGADGLDEITLTSHTDVSELKDGHVRNFSVHPEDLGFTCCAPADLKGGTPEENAAIILALLEGEAGPKRDIVLLNAAAAITVAGKCDSIQSALELARKSIDSGTARKKLESLCRVSNS
jgi:anthranilate phosphoribosyltransferase